MAKIPEFVCHLHAQSCSKAKRLMPASQVTWKRSSVRQTVWPWAKCWGNRNQEAGHRTWDPNPGPLSSHSYRWETLKKCISCSFVAEITFWSCGSTFYLVAANSLCSLGLHCTKKKEQSRCWWWKKASALSGREVKSITIKKVFFRATRKTLFVGPKHKDDIKVVWVV